MNFPNIDPIALSLGPIAIRWYSLSYIFGIILGYQYLKYLDKKYTHIKFSSKELEDLVFRIVMGVIIGGRAGYTLFYNLPFYLDNPAKILMVWEGGMSFHGGLIGFTLGVLYHAKKQKKNFLSHMDILSCTVPIGLFLGRIANFINGELWGRKTDVAWGIVFPYGGPLTRHPSQLYESLLEGVITFSILLLFSRQEKYRNRIGFLAGTFLICYGTSRFIVEYFREPDAQIGYILNFITMGQILSLPMILLGTFLIVKKDNFFTKL